MSDRFDEIKFRGVHTVSDTVTRNEIKEQYKHAGYRKVALLLFCIAGIILFAGLFSISVFDELSLRESYELIWNHIRGVEYEPRSLMWWADIYVWNTAMPHIVVGVVAGAGLAVCGTLMQSVMVNPLADPYSTGVSSGACFGAVLAIIVGFSAATVNGESSIVLNAFIGAMVPVALIIILAEKIEMTPATLILVGTCISYFFTSLVTFYMISTDADTLSAAYIWQVGDIDGIGWDAVPIMLTVVVIGSALSMFMTKKMNLMSLGDANAISLGLNVRRFRIICLIIMAFITASIIAFTGILGFVGLVAPHIVRLVIGSDNTFVMPISMAVGAFLMLLADNIAMHLSSIPVGVILSAIGSPIFLILILKQRKGGGVLY